MAAYSDYVWGVITAPVTYFWRTTDSEADRLAAFQTKLIELCNDRLPRLEARPILALHKLVKEDEAEEHAVVTRLFHEILRSYVPKPRLPKSNWRVINWLYNWYYNYYPPVAKRIDDIFARNHEDFVTSLRDYCEAGVKALNPERTAELMRYADEDANNSGQILRQLCLSILQQLGGEKAKAASSSEAYHSVLKQKAASDHKGVHCLDLSNSWQLDAKELRFLLGQTHGMHALDISYCPGITDRELYKLLKYIKRTHPDIKELRLSGTNIRDETFKYLLDNFPYLEGLAIADNPQLSDNSSGILINWTDKNPDLRRLDISGNHFFGLSIAEIVKNAKNVEELHLNSLNWLTEHEAEHLIPAIAESSGALCKLSIDWPWVTDEQLLAIAKSYPHLEEISLICNASITDKGLQAALAQWGKLRSLMLVDAPITSPTFCEVAKALPELRELGLVGCRQLKGGSLMAVGDAIKRRLKHLEELTLGSNEFTGLKWYDLFSFLAKETLAQLKGLRLISTTVPDFAITKVGQHCVSLEELVLYDCPEVSADCLNEAVALISKHNKLQKVNLSGCKVTPKVITNLAGHCSHLEFVAFDRCEGLLPLDKVVIEQLNLLIVNNPRIVELSIANLASYSEFETLQRENFLLNGRIVDPLFCNSGISAIA